MRKSVIITLILKAECWRGERNWQFYLPPFPSAPLSPKDFMRNRVFFSEGEASLKWSNISNFRKNISSVVQETCVSRHNVGSIKDPLKPLIALVLSWSETSQGIRLIPAVVPCLGEVFDYFDQEILGNIIRKLFGNILPCLSNTASSALQYIYIHYFICLYMLLQLIAAKIGSY